ncbi:MAG TPA: Type 1 glutamine amidotransferase-like domain-containing protein [Candidatus Saccharimonadales bacterium]|nr:Type 1 glutamine amidotransferase-like domain-containing protein [Candidatus Saccharimonadales bacterium]
MKLVLCSEGFHTQNTVEAFVELVGKPKDKIKFAVINEAYAGEAGDKHWVVRNLESVANNFPAEMDIVNLLAFPLEETEKRITDKDAIFVVGGHTDYLMSVFVKTGFDKLLPKLLETKVYVGSSAGSMVMGKRLDSEAYDLLYERIGFGIDKYLGFVDFSIMPHMDSPNFSDRKEKLSKAASKNKGKLYGLNDDSAVVVNGEKFDFIGSKPYEYN